MKIFISGGCKNGKSAYAQELAQKMRKPGIPLYYLATMIPADREDEERITRHRRDREGFGFMTVEVGRDILTVIDQCDRRGVFLLDSVTALLANEMFTPGGYVETDIHIKVAGDLEGLAKQIDNIVIVSDFICSDALIYDSLTEAYKQGLAYIDRQTAGFCEVVLETSCGTYFAFKGRDVFKELLCDY